MDNLEYKIKNTLTEDINIPLRYNEMVCRTLNKINKKKNNIKEKALKFIISIITTIIGMSGVCFAISGIYNNIIKQGKTFSSGLGEVTNNTTDSLLSSDMEWDKNNAFYFKTIENIEEYSKYKSAVNELPNMVETDFETNFLLIITSIFPRNPDEKNLIVADISSNEETTFIKLKQEENADVTNFNNIIYAILPKEELKPNIKIEIDHFNIHLPGYEDINNLPQDYTIDNAIKDGCLVLEKGILKSNNISTLDNLINASQNNEKNYIRIYDKVSNNEIQIIDIIYKEGLYYMNSSTISNMEREISFNSFETLSKGEIEENGNKMTIYSGMTKLYKSEESQGIPIVFINEK